MTGHASIWVEEWDRAELVLDRLVEATRDASALGRLIYPLAARSHLAFRRGRWQAALADAASRSSSRARPGRSACSRTASARWPRSSRPSGAPRTPSSTREAIELTRALGSDAIRVSALHALAFDGLTHGRVEQAIELLDEVRIVADRVKMHEPALVQWAPNHVEALARAGETERAEEARAAVAQLAENTDRTWALAATERCRGILARPAEFTKHFDRALELHQRDGPAARPARAPSRRRAPTTSRRRS